MPKTYKIIIVSSLTFGVCAFIFYFVWKKKKNSDKDDKLKKIDKTTISKEDSLKIVKPSKTLEVTTCISMEVSKKALGSPRTNINDVSSKLKYKIGEKSFKETVSPRVENNLDSPKKSIKTPNKLKKFNDYQLIEEEKFTLNNSTNDQNIEKNTPKYDSKNLNELINKKLQTLNISNVVADNTVLNIISDLKRIDDIDPDIKRKIQTNLENQGSLILDKPEFIAGDIMHESEGYLEEDDVNSKENFDNMSESLFDSEEKPQFKVKNEELINYDERIRNITELKTALQEKYKNRKYKLDFEEKYYFFQEKNVHKIIKAEEFVLILKHLYSELHSKLVEMNDCFNEERRRYFENDEKIYISIISFNLQKKEEFFLSVVSHLMGRLCISQEILDNTFYYYFHLCDQNLPMVKHIKECYEEVYNAGLKYSIAPKNLTKKLLKKIYIFQLNLYEKFTKKYANKNDVIDVMIIDHIYAEYGLDNECIKAACKKYNIKEDPDFIPILQKISQFQNNSFII